jgi:hypothetical protein
VDAVTIELQVKIEYNDPEVTLLAHSIMIHACIKHFGAGMRRQHC